MALNGTSGEFIGASTGACAGQSGGSDLAATITFTPTNVGERTAVLTVSDSNTGDWNGNGFRHRTGPTCDA